MVVDFTSTFSIRSPLSCEFVSHTWWDVFNTTLCDKLWPWFALGMLLTPVSSTNQSNAHLIAEKLSKVVLSTHYTMQLSLLARKKEKFEDTIKVIRWCNGGKTTIQCREPKIEQHKTLFKTMGKLSCYGRVGSSCSTSDMFNGG